MWFTRVVVIFCCCHGCCCCCWCWCFCSTFNRHKYRIQRFSHTICCEYLVSCRIYVKLSLPYQDDAHSECSRWMRCCRVRVCMCVCGAHTKYFVCMKIIREIIQAMNVNEQKKKIHVKMSLTKLLIHRNSVNENLNCENVVCKKSVDENSLHHQKFSVAQQQCWSLFDERNVNEVKKIQARTKYCFSPLIYIKIKLHMNPTFLVYHTGEMRYFMALYYSNLVLW